MKKTFYIVLVFAVLCSTGWKAIANNLSLSNITVNQTTKIVTFDISWDNSFRLAGAPTNWDAVWVFVKFRDCAATAATAFTHGTLHATKANHTFGANLEPMTTPCSLGLGGCGGADVTESAVQGATLDFTEGILLRRSTVGAGTTTQTSVALNITNLPAAGTTLTTKVMGVEMVYCPQADFALGDGGPGPVGATYRFLSSAANTAVPATITSAYETGAQTFYCYPNNVVTTIAGVPATWPKGQYGFYIMKYEISEGNYVEFLNTIGGVAQTARYPGNVGTNRNQTQPGIALNTYATSRPDRAQNWLAWADVSAFLDWACLRPMTETEYEKACRGTTTFTTGEFAWGSTALTATNGGTFTAPGNENGTETMSLPVGANCAYGGTSNYTNGDGGAGPLRGGIFALSNSTRVSAGATYFGVMEMTGNIWDMVVGMHSTGASNVFTRTWGNGTVNAADGNHDVAGGWPAAGTVPAGTSTTNLVGWRGSAWDDNGVVSQQVSSRNGVYNSTAATRYRSTGGRGLR